MKAYRKTVTYNSPTTSQVPVLPEMDITNDPQVGKYTNLVYAPTGDYLGFADDEQIRKYLYGKLYYKTKGAYSTHNAKADPYNKSERKIFVYLKAGRTIALFIRRRPITDLDLIDSADKSSHAGYTLEKVKDYNFSFGSVSNFPDQFKQCENLKKKLNEQQEQLRVKIAQEQHAFEANAKAQVIAYLESLKSAEQDLQDQGASVGIPTDF